MIAGSGLVMFGSGAMLPMLFVVPTAFVMMLLLATHVLAVVRSNEPSSRKRIRACNGVVMMLGVALIAVGVSILDPDRQVGLWVLCWMAAFALVWFSMVLAGLDAANTWRLAQLRRRALQQQLREAMEASRRERIARRVAREE